MTRGIDFWDYIVNFFYIKFMLGFFIWFLIIVSDRLFSSAKSNKKKTTLKVIRAKITLKEKCMGVEIFHS